MSIQPGSTALHQKLVKDFQMDAYTLHDDIFILPVTNGMFRDFESAERIIHSGLPGVPDLIVFGRGWYFYLDAKTGKAKFNDNQLRFKKRMFEMVGYDLVYKLPDISTGLALIKQFKAKYNE